MKRSVLIGVALGILGPAVAHAVLYRSDFDGEFGIVNEANGNFTVLATPGAGDPISGLCRDLDGRFWGTLRLGLVTELIEINPVSGNLVQNVGDIELGGSDVQITDLACRPSDGQIFGLDNSVPARLLTIDKATAVATLVGTTSVQRGGLAFAPDGRLFALSVDGELAEINPASGVTIDLIDDNDGCYDALAIRPSDNLGFAIECGDDDLVTVNLANGNINFVGSMGNFGADLEFSLSQGTSAPVLSGLALAGLTSLLGGLGARRIRRRAAKQLSR